MRAQAAALLFPQLLDAFCHALQSLEAAAVFSPSLGACLLLLIWGSAPGIELHCFRHRSQKLFCPNHGLYSSRDLLLAAFPLSAHSRHKGRATKGKREREREGEREGELERGREGGKGRDRKIERERERMSWRERVGVSCWLRCSRCQKFCSETSGKCMHVAMTTCLHYFVRAYRSSRSTIAPHRKSHIF